MTALIRIRSTSPCPAAIAAGESDATFTVVATDDALIDGDQQTLIGASGDGYGDAETTLTVSDDDAAGISVNESAGGTATSEDGAEDSVSVSLSAQPNGVVELSIEVDLSGEVAVDRSRLTFTPADWDAAQTVTLTGLDDDLVDGDRRR